MLASSVACSFSFSFNFTRLAVVATGFEGPFSLDLGGGLSLGGVISSVLKQKF